MQEYKFLRRIILILILVVLNAQAQNHPVYNLYNSNQISEIEKLLNNGQISEEDWRQFAEILFIEDLDSALKQYISLYGKTTDNQLKKLILDRISQYYYAKGLYESAERILDDEQFRARLFSMNIEKIYFGVQLGAFSSQENASSAMDKYSKNISDMTIIKKSSGGKLLFVVVAGKLDSKQKAEQYKTSISEKFGYKGIVIQY
ncbi:MAG: SPOR domain-containing protein [bacterium]|nr:MAG: SPOR domain-containing protein [bacterium]